MMCWYNNDQATYTANKYGALYNWYSVNTTTNGNKNVCPSGWHVPTDAELTTLINDLGGLSVAGGKIKSTDTQYWRSPNAGATNESGLLGLPSGYRGTNGAFSSLGDGGLWWSSSEANSTNAWFLDFRYNVSDAYKGSNNKPYGFSVRCKKD